MIHSVLATDYDGTLATHGAVDGTTLAALDRLRDAGHAVLLVTGREIDDLRTVFSHFDRFDLIIAENGALLHWPGSGREELLAKPPPPTFVDALRRRKIEPISVGRVIVATFEPHEKAVLEAIKETGLELQVIFNKGAVMVLPSGVNKASGLAAALRVLGIDPAEVVGVGDAENDHAFLELCGYRAAVANALPALQRHVDWVTPSGHGTGVVELIDRWLAGRLEM
jgi:hydroxymethylpyrimidine pyrophosphatase-like HAD family hydrolase